MSEKGETMFEWQGKKMETSGHIMDAMSRIHAIEDLRERQRMADAFMTAYRAHTPHADVNVGYLCGYFGTMVEMLRLFRTAHPMFGDAERAAKVTPEDAVEAGKALAAALSSRGQD